MAGKIKKMIDDMANRYSQGDALRKRIFLTKLLLKGVNHSRYNSDSPDDQSIINKLKDLEKEIGINA